MKFSPIHDYILVRPEPRKQSDVLEVVSNERMNRGTVIAAGPGKWLKVKSGLAYENESGEFLPMTVRVGDFVTYTDLDIFPKWRAHEGGEQFVIIQEADVCWYERSPAKEILEASRKYILANTLPCETKGEQRAA